MRQEDISKIIADGIRQYGDSCTIKSADNADIATHVVLSQMWRKNKTRFEKSHTPIGMTEADYYIGIFPWDCDVRGFGLEDTATVCGNSFYFVRGEGVFVGDEAQYYSAVLRRIYEEV